MWREIHRLLFPVQVLELSTIAGSTRLLRRGQLQLANEPAVAGETASTAAQGSTSGATQLSSPARVEYDHKLTCPDDGSVPHGVYCTTTSPVCRSFYLQCRPTRYGEIYYSRLVKSNRVTGWCPDNTFCEPFRVGMRSNLWRPRHGPPPAVVCLPRSQLRPRREQRNQAYAPQLQLARDMAAAQLRDDCRAQTAPSEMQLQPLVVRTGASTAVVDIWPRPQGRVPDRFRSVPVAVVVYAEAGPTLPDARADNMRMAGSDLRSPIEAQPTAESSAAAVSPPRPYGHSPDPEWLELYRLYLSRSRSSSRPEAS